MRLNTVERSLQSSGLSTRRNQFKVQNNQKMFQILSDKLYSNKIAAFVREVSCNGFDAHVAAGKKDVPIQVHIPTNLEPYFVVKDFGIGLSHDDVMDLYTTYGMSNKDHNNDMIGGFGLGSKSPFAYTDTFSVESRFNGERNIYTCYIDAEGNPNIVHLNTINTTEDNGLTVKIPVKASDVYEVKSRAEKIYKYFEVRPVTNIELNIVEDPETLYSGDKWKYINRQSYYESKLVMGNVAYTINLSDLSDIDRKDCQFLQHAVLYADIGEVDIQPSREGLELTERTKKFIQDAVMDFKDTIKSQVFDVFDKAVNPYDLAKKYKESSEVLRFLDKKDFKDTKYEKVSEVAICDYKLKADEKISIGYGTGYNFGRVKNPTIDWTYQSSTFKGMLKPSSTYVIFAGEKEPRLPSRLSAHFKDHIEDRRHKEFVLIKTSDEKLRKSLTKYLKDTIGVPDDMFIDVATDVADYKPVTSKKGIRGKVKHVTTVTAFQGASYWSVFDDNRYLQTRVDEVTDELVDAGGIYIQTKYMVPITMGSTTFGNALTALTEAGVVEPTDLIYIVSSAAKNPFKGQKGWYSLEEKLTDHYKKCCKKITGKNKKVVVAQNLLDNVKSEAIISTIIKSLKKFSEKTENKKKLKALKDTSVYRFLSIFKSLSESHTKSTLVKDLEFIKRYSRLATSCASLEVTTQKPITFGSTYVKAFKAKYPEVYNLIDYSRLQSVDSESRTESLVDLFIKLK